MHFDQWMIHCVAVSAGCGGEDCQLFSSPCSASAAFSTMREGPESHTHDNGNDPANPKATDERPPPGKHKAAAERR